MSLPQSIIFGASGAILRQFSLIPQDKKTMFGILRESILSSFQVNLETLQCFMGKVVSFSSDISCGMLYAC